MKNTIIAAAVMLLVQLTLVVFMNIGGDKNIAATPESAFLTITPSAVSSLEIVGTDGKKVVLEKKDEAWILPETFGAPVNSQTITSLLDKLAGLRKGFVVATSAEAARRFKVTDDSFERHILIKDKDTVVADFYIGTSPAFRQVHARRAGENDIVAIDLSTYELESQADKWLDTELFKLTAEDIAAIVFEEFSLERKKGEEKSGDTWLLGGDGGVTAESAEVEDLVNQIAGLRVITVIDPKTAGTGGATDFRFTVKRQDGTALDYSFRKLDNNFFAVNRSDKELTGKVGKVVVEELQQFNRDRLTGVKPEPAASAQADDAQPGIPTGSEIALPQPPPVPDATAGGDKVLPQN